MSRAHVYVSLFLAFLPLELFAGVGFSSLLPNPTGDDTLGEYIEIRNTGCEDVDISGYEIRDLQRGYEFPSGTFLLSHTTLQILYEQSHIQLNNSGHEELTLADISKNIISSASYDGNQRDDSIIVLDLQDDACEPPIEPPIDPPGDTGSGGTGSGSDGGNNDGGGSGSGSDSGSGSTGSGSESGSGSTGSGSENGTGSGSSGSGTDTGSGTDGGGGGGGSESPPSPPPDFLLLSLEYDDLDHNNKIDTLFITYSLDLTGVLDLDSIGIYSRTDGLSSMKIDTATGYIESATLSGNTLILTLIEQDLEKNELHINNTTSSDLRLKTLKSMGFTSIDGRVPVDFFLTSSFDDYRNVSRRGSGGNNDSGSGSGTGNSIVFPEIALTFQSPTNTSFSGDIITCTTTPCRVNMTLESLFSSGFAMRDYICSFGTGESLEIDSDCNPTTLYFTASGNLIVEIAWKDDPIEFTRKIYPVEWAVISSNSSSPIISNTIPDTGKPVPILELDSKWKEYYFQNGDNEILCYAYTCSINFTGEKSYDPEGSDVRFLWIYGANEISTSKDPGTRKYGLGDYSIIFRVIDAAGNWDQIAYKIHVVGPKAKEEKKKLESALKKKEKSDTIKPEKKKKPKKIKMVFFSPPDIVLQGKTGKQIGSNQFVCEYKRKPECTINFSLTGTLSKYEYVWKADDIEVYRGKNPPSLPLAPGTHRVQVITYEKGATLERDIMSYTVQVVSAPKKPKSPKKTSPKKIVSKILPLENIVPAVSAAPEIEPSSDDKKSLGLGVALFSLGLLGAYRFRRKRGI